MVVLTYWLLLVLISLFLEVSTGEGQGVWLDGFQPPELDGAPVPPCFIITIAPPPLPTTSAQQPATTATPPKPPTPPIQPQTQARLPNPTLKQSQGNAQLKRDQLLSLLVLLLTNQRGGTPAAARRPVPRTGVVATRRNRGNAGAVLPWWAVPTQTRDGTRVGSVLGLPWGPAPRRGSDSSSSEELRK
ncbi:uncharacterized protein LOC134437135 [Engraulis encrasicolus]|uniref:uncharacterized protein LOC134437135 n=1 Tax=Engraulis encrasicolus TaxID=184585 RepID=UPI002FCE739D